VRPATLPRVRRVVPLIAALSAGAVFSAHAATGSRDISVRPSVGVQFHCTWDQSDAKRRAIATKLAAAGVKSVRIDIAWTSLQPGRAHRVSRWYAQVADRCVNLARSQGMDVLATLLWTPGWANGGRDGGTPPGRATDIRWIAHWSASHFRGRVAAWEVWNEPNVPRFWKGSAGRYVRMLRVAYPAIKSGDPNTKVVFGGVTHNDDRFIARAYAAGAHGAFDVMATHPYQGVGDAAPETVDTGSDWWLLTHAPAVHDLMVRHGDGAKPIWFTEYGWSVHPNRPGMALWERGVSPEEQASYIVRSITLTAARYPYVEKVFWYKDAARPGEDQIQAGYGLLRQDLSGRPAYFALKTLLLG
jgi:hypothetical protein